MPRLVQVKSLKNISTHFVLENLKYYSTEELHSLPGQLIQDLADKCGNDNIPNVYKDRLISPTLTKLDLDLWKSKDEKENYIILYGTVKKKRYSINRTIKLISSKNLTHLNMDWDVDAANVTTLIRNLPKIVDLRFRGCNDDTLEEIGTSCPELKILFLNDPAEVTDKGISRLCQSKSKGCKIEHLKIECKKITKRGCLIVLENLMSLRIFEGCRNGLRQLLLDWLQSSPNFPILQLTQLDYHHRAVFTEKDVVFLNKICPQLRKLDVECKFLECEFNLGKAPWDQLEELKISTLNEKVDFIRCSSFLSNIIGTNFTSLSLSGQKNVQVMPLGQACPNLTSLQLVCSWSILIGNYTKKDYEIPFEKLKILKLRTTGYEHEQIVAETLQIKLLMQNCFDLEELEIDELRMKEESFISVLQLNPLFHLTKLKTCYCMTLTTAVVMELLQRENKLELVNVDCCPGINEDVVKSYIKSCNYNVRVEIKEY